MCFKKNNNLDILHSKESKMLINSIDESIFDMKIQETIFCFVKLIIS